MSNKLFVGSLSWNTNVDGLRSAFERFGALQDVAVIEDRETGRSRGFGFVTFEESACATAAQREMDGSALDGRNIVVNPAQERQRGGDGRRSSGRY